MEVGVQEGHILMLTSMNAPPPTPLHKYKTHVKIRFKKDIRSKKGNFSKALRAQQEEEVFSISTPMFSV